MPYIRLFSVPLPLDTKRRLAKDITEAVVRAMPGQKREWTTVHFTPYRQEDFATGGKLIIDGLSRDYFVESTSPNFPAEEMKAVVESLTPLLADALGVCAHETYKIDIKCNSYDPGNASCGDLFCTYPQGNRRFCRSQTKGQRSPDPNTPGGTARAASVPARLAAWHGPADGRSWDRVGP